MRASVFAAAASVACLTASASADIIFQDGTFSDTNWGTMELFGTGTSATAQVAAGGNPGAFRQLTNNLGAGAGAVIRVFHHYGTTQATRYDPAVSGPITSLNCSVDFLPISGPTGGQGIAFALKQAQIVYFAAPLAVFNNPIWQTHAVGTLTSASFIRADGLAGAPDFSAAGAPIRFGLLTYNSQGSGEPFTTEAGYDNFFIQVVPAPGSAALGLVAIVAAGRRKRPGTP